MKNVAYLICLFLLVSCGNNDNFNVPNQLKSGTRLQPIDSELRIKISSKVPLINCFGENFSASLFKEFQLKSFEAKIVYVINEHSSLFHLVIIDEKDNLVSSLVLAGDSCGNVEELKPSSLILWCGESHSRFLDKRTFFKTIIKRSSLGFACTPYYTDTLKEHYIITDKGTIALIKKDSVRLTQYMDSLGRVSSKRTCLW